MRFVRCKTTSSYEAMILAPKQAFDVLMQLEEPERTLTLLAASTGLRISECLGLQWQDVSFTESLIYVRRTWTCGKVGVPKSKASHAPVPLHPLLAEFMQAWKNKTSYSQIGELGVRFIQAERTAAKGREHAGTTSSPTGGDQGGCARKG